MKKIIPLVCLALLLQPAWVMSHPATQSATIDHGGKIETKYDGFNGETLMRLRKMKVTCDGFKDNFKDGCASIDVTLHLPGTQLNFVHHVTLQVVFESKNWDQGRHGYEQRGLAIVTDGETLRFGQMKLVPLSDTLMNEKMVEILETTIPYDVFKKMAAAGSVEIQVGSSRMELRDKNRAALRDLGNRVLATS
jgi:hypothetical protein